MRISQADFLAMQARCDAARNLPPQLVATDVGGYKESQKEVGRGGIQDEIESWLKTQSHRAWWDCKRSDQKTTSRVGIPDFVGVFSGVAFGLEVKRPGRKPTTEQLGELAWMRKAGAKTAVVCSLQEAEEFFAVIIAAVEVPPTTAANQSSTIPYGEKESR